MIKCRAIEEKSLYMNAQGIILPCCFVWREDAETIATLKHFAQKENFDDLVDSWSSSQPYNMCVRVCDDQSNDKISMKYFDKQWKIFEQKKAR